MRAVLWLSSSASLAPRRAQAAADASITGGNTVCLASIALGLLHGQCALTLRRRPPLHAQETLARMRHMFGHGHRLIFEGKSKVGCRAHVLASGWAVNGRGALNRAASLEQRLYCCHKRHQPASSMQGVSLGAPQRSSLEMETSAPEYGRCAWLRRLVRREPSDQQASRAGRRGLGAHTAYERLRPVNT